MNSPSITPVLTIEAARVEAEPWPTPRPLSAPKPPRLDLEKAIPPGLAPFREFCEATAEHIQVPTDYITPIAVAIATIGTARALEIAQASGHRETAPLWFVCLGLPSERKTGVLSVLQAPLLEWQDREGAYLKHALAAYDEKRRGIEAQLNGTRESQKKKTGPELAKAQADALALRATLENMPELLAPCLSVSTATPEGVRDGLIRNGEKLLWISDEANEADLLGKRYSEGGGGDLDLPCKAYSGSPHTVGRAKNLTHDLKRPALAVALLTQPGIFAKVMNNPEANDKGFIARLCPLYPDSRMGTRKYDNPTLPPPLLAWWNSALCGLLDLSWPGRVVLDAAGPTRCEKPTRIVRMNTDAENVFRELWTGIEARVGPDGDLRPVCGFAGKLPGVIARIALTLEALQDPAAEFITADTMKAACEWAPFLIAHFRHVLGDAAESAEVKLARRVLRWCKGHQRAEASAKEIHQGIDGDGTRREELDPALELLIEADWLRELPAAPHVTGRRPSPRYTVNPAALA
jgi:hypothetical protein